jgi:WS/DGAT/MGAT family acyltransferase
MHLGAVLLLRPRYGLPADLAVQRVVGVLRERAGRIPVLMQRLREPLLPWEPPEWVPDHDFDAGSHVCGAVIAGHTGRRELVAETARCIDDLLDRSRPLWQLRVVGGLDDGFVAVIAKVHHSLADGLRALTVGMPLFDEFAHRPHDDPGPSRTEHAAGPSRTVGRTRHVRPQPGAGIRWIAGRVTETRRAAEITGSTLHAIGHARQRGPFAANPEPGGRAFGMVALPLDDVDVVRKRLGGTVNDVLLAVTAGALRAWLGNVCDPLPVRAFVPVNLGNSRHATGGAGNFLSGYLVELPVDKPDPGQRLQLVRLAMSANKAAGPSRGPGAFPLLAARVPPWALRIAAPFAADLAGHAARRLFDLVITNVPVPDVPLHVDGLGLEEIYPIVPLAPGQGLGIAISTYRRRAHIGLHTHGETGPDPQGLARCFEAALDELLS